MADEDVRDYATAYVDGSYNEKTKVYGYGGILTYDNITVILKGSANDEDMASMRNVAGEIMGSQFAIEKAIEMGAPEIDMYYDYNGIEKWATGEWKRNKEGTKKYYEFIQGVKDTIKINFHKVKGHSGIIGNEEADKLAKEAVGLNNEEET